jgi:cyclohexanecarboxylate-CoA ligase
MWDTLMAPGPEVAARYRAAGWWRRETYLDDLAHWAQARPDHPAVIGYQGRRLERTLSYAELAIMVARFAGALAELGVGPGDVVVPYMPNRWFLTPLYLACCRLGAVAAPAQPLMGAREFGNVITTARAKVCVTVGEFNGVDYAARLAAVGPPTLHRVVAGDAARSGAIDFDEFFVATPWEERGSVPGRRASPDDPSLLVFTSGTTGQPKGVVHSQNTVYAASRSLSVPFQLTADDVVSIPQSLTHVAGAMHAVFAPVTLGATCVMQDRTSDMELLLGLIDTHQITYIHAAPAFLGGLLEGQRANPRSHGSLRVMSSSSAPIPPAMVAGVWELFGIPLYACWGMTETGGCTTTRPEDPPDWAAYSDGRPMPWMQARIDAEPGSEIGRLLIRGASLCLGYLNQPKAFAASLDGDGWFDTGDMARDDGRDGIRITGRRADLITRATGAKVSTSEMEAILARHPAISEIALIGYPDPAFPGAELVCAVIVPDREPPSLQEVRDHLSAEGASTAYWPDRVEIVAALPKNPLGKVIRAELRQQIAAGQAVS